MLFDTHLHLIYPDILRYPWLDKVDLLNKPSRYEDYHTKASRLGIGTFAYGSRRCRKSN